jgi:glyoxylase-like metal-dependent hydrolase (beta-lactamase superfamily II)
MVPPTFGDRTKMRKGHSLIIVAAVTLLLGAAAAQAAWISAARELTPLKYGTIVRLAPSTLMVVGRALDAAHGQADNGNTILYRHGGTLYVIDTGSTVSFRPFLRSAINKLRPFRSVVLFNSHGHPDHTGNNATVAKLAAHRLRYYMSRRDFPIVDHPQKDWLLRAIRAVSGYVPGFDDPVAQTHKLLGLFLPLNTLRSKRRAIESQPQQTVRIGRLRMRGWVLGPGDVDILPTRGHTPGSLSFYFPKSRLLHMADELNSYYPAFPESSPTRIRTVFGLALKAAAGHAVRLLTDGHTYNVIRGAARIRARLQSYVDGYNAFDRVFRRILTTTPGGATVSEIIQRLAKAPELANKPGGANFGPFTGALVVLKKLAQIGATHTGGPRVAQRFSLR